MANLNMKFVSACNKVIFCSIRYCSSNQMEDDKRLSFYRLPNNVIVKEQWMKNIERHLHSGVVQSAVTICHEHFDVGCFTRKGALKSNAVPTIFPIAKSAKSQLQLQTSNDCSAYNPEKMLIKTEDNDSSFVVVTKSDSQESGEASVIPIKTEPVMPPYVFLSNKDNISRVAHGLRNLASQHQIDAMTGNIEKLLKDNKKIRSKLKNTNKREKRAKNHNFNLSSKILSLQKRIEKLEALNKKLAIFCIAINKFWDINMQANLFPQLTDEVYLDHAGTTVYSQTHLQNYFNDLSNNLYGNPHSKNKSSINTNCIIKEVRKKVLEHLKTSDIEYSVIFTQNCTKALDSISKCFSFKSTKLHSSTNVETKHQMLENFERGLFVYLNDNHTSVVGMRNSRNIRLNANVLCISEQDVQKSLEMNAGEASTMHQKCADTNNLFVYPAQSNFNGKRYPLEWISSIQNHSNFLDRFANWSVLIDAASYMSTSTIDLQIHKPNFLVLSFYKIFGFPTGLGCLLVKNSQKNLLEKEYFGGGTIELMLPSHDLQVFRNVLSDKFEDGTLPFLEILAVKHGFDSLHQIHGSIEKLSYETFKLAKKAYSKLKSMTYNNEQKLVHFYHGNSNENNEMFISPITQGPIINFNLLKTDASYIGYSQVEELAIMHNIHLRTGCFCNIGACQMYLNICEQDLVDNFNFGHVCGDGIDLIGSKPTGSVRISFGSSSTLSDVEYFCDFLSKNFLSLGNKSINELTLSACSIETNVEYTLKEIWIYPIKSCSGIKMKKCALGSRGLKLDRHWMVARSSSGKCVDQKLVPHLCKVKVTFADNDQSQLLISFEGHPDLHLNVHENSQDDQKCSKFEICSGKVCGDRIIGTAGDNKINEWFSQILNVSDIKLVMQSEEDTRVTKQTFGQLQQETYLSLSNEAQYLLIGTASLEYLQKTIVDNARNSTSETLDLDTLAKRFRANFIVQTKRPFEEDNWLDIQIGSENFKTQKLCNRCKMICYDQNTGLQTKEPLLSLMNIQNRKATFGILLMHCDGDNKNCEVYCGDILKIINKRL